MQLCKIRMATGANPEVLADDVFANPQACAWSPAGNWILYQTPHGLSLVSRDGGAHRFLTARLMWAFVFSQRGDQVYGIFRDSTAHVWRLLSIDVKAGSETQVATLDLPPDALPDAQLSLHPDGERVATSLVRNRDKIYMLEGFDEPKSWLDRLRGF